MPFRHPDRSADLAARIEYEVRERVEEAVDYVCLQALVRERRARGLPPPAADNANDRLAYTDRVLAFLRLLRRELTPALSPDGQRKAAGAGEPPGDEQTRLIAVQVAMARTLPDYWQRFEAVSGGYLDGQGAPSGRESRGLLARLFGNR
jgi:hypothetical protein